MHYGNLQMTTLAFAFEKKTTLAFSHICIFKRKNEKLSLRNTKPINLQEETGQSIYFMPIARKISTYKKKEKHYL